MSTTEQFERMTPDERAEHDTDCADLRAIGTRMKEQWTADALLWRDLGLDYAERPEG